MSKKSGYTPEIGAKICELLATGKSLRAICRENSDLPTEATVRKWVIADAEFATHYTRARDLGLDCLADEIIEIADTQEEGVRVETGREGTKEVREDMLGHRRLKVDTRKWYLSKLAPKRYGDRLELDGKVDARLTVVSGVPEASNVDDLV